MPVATMTIVVFPASSQFAAEFCAVAGALAATCAIARQPQPALAPYEKVANAAAGR